MEIFTRWPMNVGKYSFTNAMPAMERLHYDRTTTSQSCLASAVHSEV